MDSIVYLNGEFIASSGAMISIYDGGFLHGAGLFETMRAD
ncbi:MAG: branched-chain amino acid aminotransferase, partial [Planctomycetes bacterium]|nr:branched-chain amino acid aminotransferase [Planctomycetota bacterium]